MSGPDPVSRGDSGTTPHHLGSMCSLCRDLIYCLPESVLGSANSNLHSLVTFFLLFCFSSSFIPPIRARGLTGAVMKRVHGNSRWPTAHATGCDMSVRQRQSACSRPSCHCYLGLRQRPAAGWSLDRIGLVLHTLRLFFLSILSEKGLVCSSLASDFQASWLLPGHSPTWLDEGDPVAWERDLLLIFLSYKNWFFP